MSCRPRRYNQKSHGYGTQTMSTHRRVYPRAPDDKFPLPPSGKYWQPLPAWEKSFIVNVGGMPWRRFVEAKKNIYETEKVYGWDDSAALMAFNEAKQRFWAEYHGFPCKKRLPSADMYIDKYIDWNPKVDPVLFSEIKAASDDENVDEGGVEDMDWYSIPLDQIKPTGWDYDCRDYAPRLPELVGS
ncbi:hypothetical protein PTKIN_Ptkin05aG0030800 [Pterospermum kingtungense]